MLCRAFHSGDNVSARVALIGREDVPSVALVVRDRTIREGWNCFDFLTMYQQIGVVRLPDA